MPRWQLIPQLGKARLLPAHPAVLGRSSSCELHLDDDTVSRHHAELTPRDDGVLVRDLGSSNGIRVNGVKVTRALLATDDLVAFGDVLFRVARTFTGPGAQPAAGRDARVEDQSSAGPPARTVDVRSGAGVLARLRAERLARLV